MARVASKKLLLMLALTGWAGAASVALDAACIPELHQANLADQGAPGPDGATDDGPTADGIVDAQPGCAYDCLGGDCRDGTCQPFVVFQATNGKLPNDLIIDDALDALYWVSRDGSVFTIPLKPPFVAPASTPVMLEDADVNPFQLTSYGGRVYWTCSGDDAGNGARIGEVRAANVPTTVVAPSDGGLPLAPKGIAVSETTLGKLLVWVNGTPDASIMVSSLDGTGAQFLASFPEAPGRMEPSISASTVYVACAANAPGVTGVLYAVDLASRTTRALWDAASGSQPMIEFVEQAAVNGSSSALYGVQDNRSPANVAPRVIQQPLPQGLQAAISLGTSPGHAYGITSDGASSLFVAVADSLGNTGRIFRVDFTRFGAPGAPAIQIAQTDLGAYRVAYWLRGNAVFWTANERTLQTSAIYGMAVPPNAH
jgi:hypothetical protein